MGKKIGIFAEKQKIIRRGSPGGASPSWFAEEQ